MPGIPDDPSLTLAPPVLDVRVLVDALDTLNDGVLVLDASLRVVHANARAARLLHGVASETLHESSTLMVACRRARHDGKPVTVDWEDPTRSLCIEARVAPTPGGVTVRIQDVTAQRTAEAERKASIERLETERRLFRAILDQMPTGAIVAAPSGKLLFGNRQFETLFAGELLGAESIADYGGYVGFHPDGTRYLPSEWPLARSLSTGEVVADERVPFERRDGKRIVARFRSGPIYDDEKRLIGGVVFMDDVTAEVVALHDLTVTKSLLQGIMDHSTTVIYAKDLYGRFLFVNRHFLSLLGLDPSRVLGATDYDILPPESARAFRANDEEVIKTNSPIEREETVPGRKGTQTFISATFPVRDEAGRVYAVAGVSTDVTARVRIEHERDASLALLDTFLEASPVGFAVLDSDLRYVRVNAALAKINGLAAEEHLGKTPRELFRDLTPEVDTAIRAVLAMGEPIVNVELDLATPAVRAGHAEDPARPASSVRHFWISIYPIRIANRIDAAGVTVVDVTEQKKLAQQLIHEGQLRELFVAVLAHDLRNPLSAISLGAEAMRASADLPPQAARHAQLVVNSARRMSGLIEQLLDFSRVRFDAKVPLVRKPCDLSQVCADVIREVETSHPARAILFTATGDTQGMWDPVRLSQVASNLLNNAATYATEATAVSVEVTGSENQVSLSVSNQGAPIPDGQLTKLFDPFERASRKTRSPSEGLGLGLFIADQVVRAHGGRIEATSDATATTFRVQLPRK